MLKIDEDRIRPLLEDVRYHSIIVVGLAFKGIDPPVGFTQIVTPDLPATTIFRTPSSAPDEPVITMFFGADTYAELSPKRDEEIISLARQILRQSGAMSFHDEQVTFQRVQRWEQGTVKRSASVAAAEKSGPVVVKDRIFLAGDYLCPMGSVGMNCAVWSGQQAARAVVESFRIENSTQQD
jgi:protoporphyrinogen oxidase